MRVLVLHTGWLGDLLLLSPLLQRLVSSDRVAELGFLTTAVGVAIYGELPGIERIHRFEKRRNRMHIGDLARLVRSIRGRYDAVLIAHRSHRSGLLAFLSGANRRIGFAGAAGQWACTTVVPWDLTQHVARRYGALATPLLGSSEVQHGVRLPIDPKAQEKLRRRLGRSVGDRTGPLLVLAPGAAWETKRWRLEGFVETGQRLVREGFDVVVSGTAAEFELCRTIADQIEGAVNIAGRTTVSESLSLYSIADVAVCNDSGSGHLAGAVGCPVVSIFGPTVAEMGYSVFADNVQFVAREGLDCRPCHRHGPQQCPLGHHDCMRTIDTDAVVAAVHRSMQPAAGSGPTAGVGGERLANDPHRAH